jgi:glutamate 5-kinase
MLDSVKVFKYAEAIALAHGQGEEIILVTSGAIAAGLKPLGFSQRPTEISKQQAAAAVGQAFLIWQYERAFAQNSITIGQVLLTQKAIEEGARRENVVQTIEQLLQMRVIPVVNENDTVATDELTFGDNDCLAALCAKLLNADHLILLTDVDALYTAPPSQAGAQKISTVEGVDELNRLEAEIELAAPSSKVGTGGMKTKLLAARIALEAGIDCYLTSADQIVHALEVVGRGISAQTEQIGTRFSPDRSTQ